MRLAQSLSALAFAWYRVGCTWSWIDAHGWFGANKSGCFSRTKTNTLMPRRLHFQPVQSSRFASSTHRLVMGLIQHIA
jgi:hypothetical protein